MRLRDNKIEGYSNQRSCHRVVPCQNTIYYSSVDTCMRRRVACTKHHDKKASPFLGHDNGASCLPPATCRVAFNLTYSQHPQRTHISHHILPPVFRKLFFHVPCLQVSLDLHHQHIDVSERPGLNCPFRSLSHEQAIHAEQLCTPDPPWNSDKTKPVTALRTYKHTNAQNSIETRRH